MKSSEILLLAGKQAPKRKQKVFSDSEDEHEDLFFDSDDRNRLMSMPESKREKILFERHSKLKELKEKKELGKRLSSLENKTKQEVESDEDVVLKEEDTEKIEFEPFSSCVLSRDFLVKNSHKPLFRNCIGHFVKFRRSSSYIVGKIAEVTEGEIYKVHLNNKEVKTGKYLKILSGKNEYSNIKLEFISNAPLLEKEFESFVNENKEDFSMKKILKDVENLKKLMSRPLFEKDAPEQLGEKQKFSSLKNSTTFKKISLIQARMKALESKQYNKAEKLREEIEAIESAEIPKEDVWEKINERNRKLNYEISRRAAEEEATKEDSEADLYNPFKRKKTRQL